MRTVKRRWNNRSTDIIVRVTMEASTMQFVKFPKQTDLSVESPILPLRKLTPFTFRANVQAKVTFVGKVREVRHVFFSREFN